MVKITWNKIALSDLEEIEEYISTDSPVYALRIIEKIHARTNILIKYPKVGRVVPEFSNSAIREILEGNYRIVYWVKNPNELIILRVHHSARLLK